MQGIRTRAAFGIGVIICVQARGSVGLAIALRPGITLTGGSVENIVSAMKDCQMHDDHTVAT